MKFLMSGLAMVILSMVSNAQPSTITVATDKTVSLVFPSSIKHVDCGSSEVLVQIVDGADHILLVKAASTALAPTNISVITSEDSIYAIPVVYGEPAVWVYQFLDRPSASIASRCDYILDNPPVLKGIKKESGAVQASLSGIYIKGEVFYFQLVLTNPGPIDYEVDLMRFWVRDQHRSRRTASQESELRPLHVAGNDRNVPAFGQTTIVVAVHKFGLPPHRYLAIEIKEEGGARQLKLKLRSRHLLKALSLPELD